MKRTVLFILALSVAGAACKKTAGPTNSGLGLPTTYNFSGTGLPSAEIPNPVTNAESVGRAFFNATLRVTRDGGGAITGGKMDFGVAVTSFPSGTNFTAMHIHRGDAATSGPIVVQTGLSNGELQLTNGAGNFSKTNNDVAASLANEIIANPAGFYFNIHTTLNGGGVARGQLVLGTFQ